VFFLRFIGDLQQLDVQCQKSAIACITGQAARFSGDFFTAAEADFIVT
jgi:hypothetical protein